MRFELATAGAARLLGQSKSWLHVLQADYDTRMSFPRSLSPFTRISVLLMLTALVATATSGCGRRRGTGTGLTDGGRDSSVNTPDGGTNTDGGVSDLGTRDMSLRDFGVDLGGSVGEPCPPYAHVSGSCASPADGDIAIDSLNRLYVYHLGVWQGVCDDGFTVTTASVACVQLGYLAGTFATTSGTSDVFWLDSVSCLGDETRLADCSHDDWGSEDCGSTEWVALTCEL